MNDWTVPSTIREAFVQASSFLAKQAPQTPGEPTQEPDRAAMLLLKSLGGWSQSELILHWDEPFPVGKWEQWKDWLSRKAQGEPVQYITGEAPFYGRPLRVTPAVLVPRPETELLVEQVSRRAQEMFRPGEAVTMADIGTGSGAIAVTLSLLNPHWRVVATDLSPEALEVARENAQTLGVEERIRFLGGDLLEPLIRHMLAAEIIVSNPPYIPTAQIAGLMPEVRDFEPHLALDGGGDGLDLYRALVRQLPLLPAMPRIVGLEVGAGQARQVADLLSEAAPWERIDLVRDFAGIERHVIAIR